MKSFPTPTTVKSLQGFVGMVNYYHSLLLNIAATMAPLYAALTGKPKTLSWGPAQATAFDAANQALSSTACLKFPTPCLPLVLSTDTSDISIGAVLEQVLHGARQMLAFFSRKLLMTETRYSTFDRELLAVHAAVSHFRHLLEGASFTIQTDHLPLVHAFTKKTDPCSTRQQWHLSAISEYDCTLQHSMFPVKENLSQTPSRETPYHRSVSASTTNILPACNRKTLRRPSVGRPSPPFSGRTSPSKTTGLQPSATWVPAALALGSLFLSAIKSLTLSKALPILPPIPQLPSSNRSSDGTASWRTPRIVPLPISPARPPKSTATPNPASVPFPSPSDNSPTCMSTSSDLCLLQKATNTASPSSIAPPAGRKPRPWSMPRPPPALPPSSAHWSPDSASPSTLRPTEVPPSHPSSGHPFTSSSVPRITIRRPTTLKPTAW